MTKVIDVPLSRIVPVFKGRVYSHADAVVLVTSPGQWSYNAQAEFELPGVESESRLVSIRLTVESGAIGIGWLSDSAWVDRTLSRGHGVSGEYTLTVPQGAIQGQLIFDNATEDGRPAVAVIEGIWVSSPVDRAGEAPVDTEAIAGAETGSSPGSEGEAAAEAASGSESEPVAEAEPEASSGSDSVAVVEAEPEGSAGSESYATTEAEPDAVSGPETEMVAETEHAAPASESDAVAEAESDTAASSDTEAHAPEQSGDGEEEQEHAAV